MNFIVSFNGEESKNCINLESRPVLLKDILDLGLSDEVVHVLIPSVVEAIYPSAHIEIQFSKVLEINKVNSIHFTNSNICNVHVPENYLNQYSLIKYDAGDENYPPSFYWSYDSCKIIDDWISLGCPEHL